MKKSKSLFVALVLCIGFNTLAYKPTSEPTQIILQKVNLEETPWQIGLGYGLAYGGLGIQFKRTLSFTKNNKIGAWLGLGLYNGLGYNVGIDYYLFDELYLSASYGIVANLSPTLIDPITRETSTFSENFQGPSLCLNYDWFFTKNLGASIGLGASYYYPPNSAADQIAINGNIGLKYAF